MNNFIYDIPVKVYFGENQLGHLGEELSKYGKRVLLTYGGGSIKKSELYDAVVSSATLKHRIRLGDWQIRCFLRYRSLIRL